MTQPKENRTIHKEEHLGSSAFITDIVIGMSDGLTVPFALAAGLSGAVQSNAVVITAGIAEIVAGSIAMGLGGYFKSKVTGQPPLKGAFKVTFIGITAAIAAFLVAKTFNNLL